MLLLFTQPRRRKILRSSDAGSCIDRPLRAARMASEARHAAWRRSTVVVLDKDSGRRIHRLAKFRYSPNHPVLFTRSRSRGASGIHKKHLVASNWGGAQGSDEAVLE